MSKRRHTHPPMRGNGRRFLFLPKAVRRSLAVFFYFFRAEPLRGCIMLASMIVAGMLEGIGVAALLPLLNTITGQTESKASFIAHSINDGLTSVGLEPTLGTLLGFVVVLITAKAVIMVFAAKQIGYTAATVTMNLRLSLLRHLMEARWSYFVRQRMGSISAGMTTEPSRAAGTYVQVARALTGILQLMVYISLSIMISIEVSLAAMFVGLVSGLLLHRFVVMTGRSGQQQTRLTKSLLSRLSDGLLLMKPIKAMAREPQISAILSEDIVQMNEAQRLQILARESLLQYREPITAATLAVGLFVILTYSNLDLESLLVMAFLFLRTVARVSSLQNNFQAIAGTLPAYWFVRSMLASASNAVEQEAGGKPPSFRSSVALDGVSFAYQKNRPTLHEVSLEIPKGSFVAIVGPSGSGKTTVADLLMGLLKPTRGSILIDGQPLSETDRRAWRRMIGYVPQDTPLLHDTVLNNITLRDSRITEDMACESLKQAGAWSFITALPDGIHSVVGERGARLSGGQRQRIAIARALAHRPALLILDEATTALDPQTEAAICDTLSKLSGKLTIVAISHQEAVQKAAEVVYRVEDGALTKAHRPPAWASHMPPSAS